jgi:hypothetical protein
MYQNINKFYTLKVTITKTTQVNKTYSLLLKILTSLFNVLLSKSRRE